MLHKFPHILGTLRASCLLRGYAIVAATRKCGRTGSGYVGDGGYQRANLATRTGMWSEEDTEYILRYWISNLESQTPSTLPTSI